MKLPRVKQAQMETHGAVASYCPDGRLDVISTTQAPYPTKMILAEALDLPVSKVAVRNPPYVGGGFGVRIGLSGKAEILAAALSMKCGRPVKLIYTREEDFTWLRSRHGGYLECRLGRPKGRRLCGAGHTGVAEHRRLRHLWHRLGGRLRCLRYGGRLRDSQLPLHRAGRSIPTR